MTPQDRAVLLIDLLKRAYPDAPCALRYEGDPFRLLVMAMLSAQCTDLRVNAVSEALFARFPDAASMAQGDVGEIEALIRSCGLYRTKAKNIKEASAQLCRLHGGRVPSEMDALLALPGVGRKIANLIRGDLYGLGGIVADTHCIRLCGRLGFCEEGTKDPIKVERILSGLVPVSEQSDFCHRLVLLGRDCCGARRAECERCAVRCACAAR